MARQTLINIYKHNLKLKQTIKQMDVFEILEDDLKQAGESRAYLHAMSNQSNYASVVPPLNLKSKLRQMSSNSPSSKLSRDTIGAARVFASKGMLKKHPRMIS